MTAGLKLNFTGSVLSSGLPDWSPCKHRNTAQSAAEEICKYKGTRLLPKMKAARVRGGFKKT